MTLASEEFAEQVAPLRPGLLLHCYRMLGSSHDAEDAVQETLLRGWRGVDRFEGRHLHEGVVWADLKAPIVDFLKARLAEQPARA